MSPTEPTLTDGPSPALADPPSIRASLSVLALVEEQLRFADSKAAFVATLHAFLIGPLGANVLGIRAVIHAWDPAAYFLLIAPVLAYIAMYLVTMGFVAAAVLPRTKRKAGPSSRAFFGRIAREYEHDPLRYGSDLAGMSDRDWLDELGVYIVDASAIAAAKHRMVRLATQATVPTVALWLLVVVVLACAGFAGHEVAAGRRLIG